jgi:hypothetical protein
VFFRVFPAFKGGTPGEGAFEEFVKIGFGESFLFKEEKLGEVCPSPKLHPR